LVRAEKQGDSVFDSEAHVYNGNEMQPRNRELPLAGAVLPYAAATLGSIPLETYRLKFTEIVSKVN